MSQYRGWCFTLNNYSELDEVILEFLEEEKHFVYVVVGFEIAESGTPHMQGYIYFSSKKTLVQMRKLFDGAHWEPAKGDPDQNYEYCTKDGDFFEAGIRPKSKLAQGELARARYDEALDLAKSGDLFQIDSELLVRHYSTWKLIAKDLGSDPEDLGDTCGVWIYGLSGVGKSRVAREMFPGAYFKNANKWWDGYQMEDNVILDDLAPNHFEHSSMGYNLKLWTDRYSFTAEIKGGAVKIRPKQFIVTSQYSIEDCVTDRVTFDAIYRRFSVIYVESYDKVKMEFDRLRLLRDF